MGPKLASNQPRSSARRRSSAESTSRAAASAARKAARVARSKSAAASGWSAGTPKKAPSENTKPSLAALYEEPQPAVCAPEACAESASGGIASGSPGGSEETVGIARRASPKHVAMARAVSSSTRTHPTPLRCRLSATRSKPEGSGSHRGGGVGGRPRRGLPPRLPITPLGSAAAREKVSAGFFRQLRHFGFGVFERASLFTRKTRYERATACVRGPRRGPRDRGVEIATRTTA